MDILFRRRTAAISPQLRHYAYLRIGLRSLEMKLGLLPYDSHERSDPDIMVSEHKGS
jgi:hypothetical protein